MDKKEFNELEVLDQLKYINSILAKGESLRSISDNLSMSKTTFRDRFIKINYIFDKDLKQYIKDTEYKHNTNVLQELKTVDNKEVVKHEYKHNTNIFDTKDNKEKILNILEKHDNIQEMLEWYNSQKNVINVDINELKIDSDKLMGEVKTTTVRLYSEVWEQFREFMESYKEYKSMDLISMALVEYMKNYSKK